VGLVTRELSIGFSGWNDGPLRMIFRAIVEFVSRPPTVNGNDKRTPNNKNADKLWFGSLAPISETAKKLP
jgi:hypothetical protein